MTNTEFWTHLNPSKKSELQTCLARNGPKPAANLDKLNLEPFGTQGQVCQPKPNPERSLRSEEKVSKKLILAFKVDMHFYCIIFPFLAYCALQWYGVGIISKMLKTKLISILITFFCAFQLLWKYSFWINDTSFSRQRLKKNWFSSTELQLHFPPGVHKQYTLGQKRVQKVYLNNIFTT